MKKRIIIFTVLLAFVFLLTGCNKEKEEEIKVDFKLRIKESSWSGWTENYKPKEVTNDYEVVLDKEYSVDSDYFKFKITKINKDSIIIQTESPYSDKEKGIDLNSKKTEFEIFLDKETELTTPTMDEGRIYYLQLVE